MMKNIFLIITAFLMAFGSESCQKEPEYSCDPVINRFVKENLVQLSSFSLTDICNYDLPFQRAIFRSWDYQKKRNAWIQKFETVLADTGFSLLEKNHIQKIVTHLSEDYFTDTKLKSEVDVRNNFSKEWIRYASDELGFSKKFIAFLIYSLYTDTLQFESEIKSVNSIKSQAVADSEMGDCGCSQGDDWCGDSSTCNSGNCTATSSGCGWLFSSPCDGYCN